MTTEQAQAQQDFPIVISLFPESRVPIDYAKNLSRAEMAEVACFCLVAGGMGVGMFGALFTSQRIQSMQIAANQMIFVGIVAMALGALLAFAARSYRNHKRVVKNTEDKSWGPIFADAAFNARIAGTVAVGAGMLLAAWQLGEMLFQLQSPLLGKVGLEQIMHSRAFLNTPFIKWAIGLTALGVALALVASAIDYSRPRFVNEIEKRIEDQSNPKGQSWADNKVGFFPSAARAVTVAGIGVTTTAAGVGVYAGFSLPALIAGLALISAGIVAQMFTFASELGLQTDRISSDADDASSWAMKFAGGLAAASLTIGGVVEFSSKGSPAVVVALGIGAAVCAFVCAVMELYASYNRQPILEQRLSPSKPA